MVSPGERVRSLEEGTKWTLAAAVAFGVAGVVSAIAFLILIGFLGELPVLKGLGETAAYVVSLVLVSAALGGVLGGTYWNLLFERVSAETLERHSAWGYHVSGGLVGFLNGVFVHLATVWIALLIIRVGAFLRYGATPFSRVTVIVFLVVPFISLLLLGWVSVTPYILAGACLGAARHLDPFAVYPGNEQQDRKVNRD